MGISPACKFISGEQSFIEICTDDDEIKRITLAEAGFDEPQHDHQHDKAESDCLFCFASSHGKALKADAHKAELPALAAYFQNGRGLYTPKSEKTQSFEARAPPALIV